MVASSFENEVSLDAGNSGGWSPFDRLHLMLPLLAVALGVLLEYLDLDLSLESLFYDAATRSWLWREHWLTQAVLHDGGRLIVNLVGVTTLLGIGASLVFAPMVGYRKTLICLLLAMASGPLLVGYFKSVSHIYSPWDLALFGGKQEYVKLFDAVPRGAPVGHAFPAGHASGGFALTASYFALGMTHPRRRFWGLGLGLGLGFLFGFAQQMRGAHFLSHDLFSLAVCWCSGWLVFLAFFGRELTRRIDPRFA